MQRSRSRQRTSWRASWMWKSMRRRRGRRENTRPEESLYTENRDSESHDDDEGKSILSRNFSPIVSFVTYLFRAAVMYISYKHCLRVAGWLAGWLDKERVTTFDGGAAQENYDDATHMSNSRMIKWQVCSLEQCKTQISVFLYARQRPLRFGKSLTRTRRPRITEFFMAQLHIASVYIYPLVLIGWIPGRHQCGNYIGFILEGHYN